MTHLVAYYAADRRLIAAFVAHAASHPSGWADAIAFHRDVARALARLVASGPDGFDASSAGRAAELAVHVVLAFLDHDVLYGDTPGVASPFAGEELAEQLTRMVVAYLRGETGDA
ncbi:MAG: hypothetical protein IPK07_32585 [Deltaproteobacteria bacterium]|nr:hypothetical protein [Deltaproteobacteria bacterium]